MCKLRYNAETPVKMIICLCLLSFWWITPAESRGFLYPDFVGYAYRNNTKCGNAGKIVGLNYSIPRECLAQCKEYGNCRVFTVHKSTSESCILRSECRGQQTASKMETWISCIPAKCEVCKQDHNVCEACIEGSGYTGPKCKDFGKKFFEGYHYQAHFACKGVDLERLPKRLSEECYAQCKVKRRKCKAFAVDENADCFLKRTCVEVNEKQKFHLWKACDALKCKVCNTSTSICDICSLGWGGQKCNKRVTIPPPAFYNPVEENSGAKLLVKILLYLLFAFSTVSCVAFYVVKRYRHHKRHTHH